MKQVRLNNGVMLVSPTATASAWSATSIRPATCRAGSRPSPSAAYGAVKEQSSGLYARILAERGFVTLAFDPSYSGESGGQPRYISSGEIYTDDYSAAVDYLMLQPEVDMNRIGILGICGFGRICVNAAVQDTRIKATVSSTMGAFDPYDKEQRYELRRQLNELRTADLLAGRVNERSGGVPTNLPDDAEQCGKTTGIITRHRADIIPVRQTPTAGGKRLPTCPSSPIRSSITLMRFTQPYSLFTVIKLTPSQHQRRHTPS